MSQAKRFKFGLMDVEAKRKKLANNNLLDFLNKIISKIFEYLDDCTLLKAARVCRRFKEIAGITVAEKYNGESFGRYYELVEYAGDGRQEKIQHLPFLQVFRGKINAVRVSVLSDHIQRSNWMIDSIEKYCASISKFVIKKSAARASFYIIDLADILTNLQELTYLYLCNADINNTKWAHNHYSCLADVYLFNLKSLGDDNLKQFLRNNKQVQNLTYDHKNLTIDAFNKSDLKRICLFRGLKCKSAMKGQLKSVKMNNLIQIEIPNECGELIEAICSGCKNIMFFYIFDLNDSITITDHQVDAICSLNNIQVLRIAGVKLTVDQVTKLISKLKKMVRFEYQSHYETLEEYQSIIVATKNHRSLATIQISASKIPAAFTVNADFHKFFIASAKFSLKLILWDSFEITRAKITKSGKLMYSLDFGLQSAAIVETNMLQLKDKCFLKIFEELDTEDLWALYRTCTKLQKLLEPYFQEKYNEGIFPFRTQGSLGIIRHFGEYISHVSVEVKQETSLGAAVMWNGIQKSCGVHLTELVLMGSSISGVFKCAIDNQIVFPALRKLKFDALSPIAINALTSKHSFCPNLQWLEFGSEQSNDDLQLDVNLDFGSNLNNLNTIRFWRYNDNVVNILNALNTDVRDNLHDLVLSNIIDRVAYGYRYHLSNAIVNAIVRFPKLTSLKLILSRFDKANMKYLFENCSKFEAVALFCCPRAYFEGIDVLNSSVNLQKLQLVVANGSNDVNFQKRNRIRFSRIDTSTHDIKS